MVLVAATVGTPFSNCTSTTEKPLAWPLLSNWK